MVHFSDFVAIMLEAAGRVLGPDTAVPLIKQLVYEQCAKEFTFIPHIKVKALKSG